MLSKPLLSICIPTYNRENYLKECLDSIVYQEGFDLGLIEIVISDNDSKDDTMLLVHKYQSTYKNIIYHKNNQNIGAIKNILNLPNYANGEYIWFLSDDDMLTDIAIDNIINIIKSQNSSLILSHFFGFWDGTPIDTQKINRKGNTINLFGIDNFFAFIAETKYDITSYMMLLSIFCFKKSIYLNHLKYLLEIHGEKYIEILNKDNFIHSRILFLPFGNKEKISVIEKDLVLCRGGNISWSFRRVVCQDLLRLIQDLDLTYKINKKAYRKMKMVYFYSVFTYIFMTHIRKYIPKFLYDALVYIGRHTIKFIKKSKRTILNFK